MALLPTAVSGHAVHSPQLVSCGNNGRLAAYAVSKSLFLVASMDSATTSAVYSVPPSTTLSCIALHGSLPLVAVGTATQGLFVASLDRLPLSSEHQLGATATSGAVQCVAFLGSGAGGSGGGVMLAVGSLQQPQHHAKAPQGPAVYSLSVWDATTRTLLWLSTVADKPETMCAFNGARGFVLCCRKDLSLWSISEGGGVVGGGRQGTGKTGSALEVRCRACQTIPELKGAEYVSVASSVATPAHVYGLTTAGFLVCFDKADGSIIKWMDCKVCPATAVYCTSQHVVVCGALVRFFTATTWDFCGKIRSDGQQGGGDKAVATSYLTTLFQSLWVAAAVSTEHVALFNADGELCSHALGADVKPNKIVFRQTRRHPPLDAAHVVRFVSGVPAKLQRSVMWTPVDIRLVDASLRIEEYCAMATSCCTYHAASGMLVVFETATHELVALDDTLNARGRLPVTEPLVSLAALAEDRLVGLSPNNTLHYFALRRQGGGTAATAQNGASAAVELEFVCAKRLSTSTVSVQSLAFANKTLCGVASNAIFNVSAGTTLKLDATIAHLATTAERLVLAVGSAVCIADPVSQRTFPFAVNFPVAECAVDAAVTMVAARSYYDPQSASVTIAVVKLPEGDEMERFAVQADVKAMQLSRDGKTIVVCEASGLLSEWPTRSGKPSGATSKAPAAAAAAPAAVTRENAPAATGATRRRAQSSAGGGGGGGGGGAHDTRREELQRRYDELDNMARRMSKRYADVNSSGLLITPEADRKKPTSRRRPPAPSRHADPETTTAPSAPTATATATTGYARWSDHQRPTELPQVASTTGPIGTRFLEPPAGARALLPSTARAASEKASPLLISPLNESDAQFASGAGKNNFFGNATGVVEAAVPSVAAVLRSTADVTASLAAKVLASERAKLTDLPMRSTSPLLRSGDVEVRLSDATGDEEDVVVMDSVDDHRAASQQHHKANMPSPITFAPPSGSQRAPVPTVVAAPPAIALAPVEFPPPIPRAPAAAAPPLLAMTRKQQLLASMVELRDILLDETLPDTDATELCSAVVDVVSVLQTMRSRRPQSACSAMTQRLDDAVATTSSHAARNTVNNNNLASMSATASSVLSVTQFNTMWVEMQHLREQNDRISSQNRDIMDALLRMSRQQQPQ